MTSGQIGTSPTIEPDLMATSQSISTSPRGGRPLVEASGRLRISDLRSPFGWRSHDVTTPDGTVVRCRVEVGEGQGFGWVFVEHRPAGSRWSTIAYEIGLSSTPQHLGGRRWWFSCPVSGVRCSALYLPVGASSFGSRQGHGLAFASQRRRAPARAAVRVDRLRQDLGGPEPSRPKGMHAAIFARRLALLASLEDAASAE